MSAEYGRRQIRRYEEFHKQEARRMVEAKRAVAAAQRAVATKIAIVQDREGGGNRDGERREAREILSGLDAVAPTKPRRRVAVLASSAGEASAFAVRVATHYGVAVTHCECFLANGTISDCCECLDEYLGPFDFVVAIVSPGLAKPLAEELSSRIGRPGRHWRCRWLSDIHHI